MDQAVDLAADGALGLERGLGGVLGAGGRHQADADDQREPDAPGVPHDVLSVDELQLAKGAFALSRAGFFETNESTADTIDELFTYDLPLDYHQRLPSLIDAVRAEDVQRTAVKYIHPNAAVVIAVGDRAKIEPELKKLSIPVELRDFEGNPVKEATAKP